MTRPWCSVCGYTLDAHYGVDCRPQPAPPDDGRLRFELSRLHAKHKKFADETGRIISELTAEVERLKAELGRVSA